MRTSARSNVRYAVTGFQHGRKDPSEFPRSFLKMTHVHNEVEINFIEQGSLQYRLGGVLVTIPAGHFVIFWAVMPHQLVQTEPSTVLNWFHIPLPWFLSWNVSPRLRDRILNGELIIDTTPENSGEDFSRVSQWHRDLQNDTPEVREIVLLEIEARVKRLALQSNSRQAESHPFSKKAIQGPLMKLEQMAQFIALHYSEPIGAKEIAKSVQLHPDSATRLFRKIWGTSLHEYLTQHRIFHAQRLLVTTKEKVLDIALASGFGSASQFYAVFSKACGCTPQEYREAIINRDIEIGPLV